MIVRVPPTNLLTSITRVSTGFLDTVDEAYQGGATSNPLGTSPYSMLGSVVRLNHIAAGKAGKNITLYGGEYMYVKFAASTGANAQGQLVFWDTYANTGMTNYTVTPDAAVAGEFLAGVALKASTKSQYGWIQISGLANVLCAASITDNTLGDVAFIKITSSLAQADFNTLAGISAAQLSSAFGMAYTQPVAGASKLVWLF